MKIEKSALWKKQTKNGDTYLSVSITTDTGEKLSINMFKNKFKEEGDNKPDFVSIEEKAKPEKPPIVPKSKDPF